MSIIMVNLYPAKRLAGVSFKGTTYTISYLWSKVLLAIVYRRPLAGFQRQDCCQEHFALKAGIMINYDINNLNIPKTTGYIYVVYFPSTGEYKIGKTVNPKARLSRLKNQHNCRPEVLHLFHTDDMDRIEAYLHVIFMDQNICGQQSHKNNNSEYYHLSKRDIEFVKTRFHNK